MFQRQLHMLAEDNRHRTLLEDSEGLLGIEAVGEKLFALQGVDFFAESGQPHALCGGGAGGTDAFGVRDHGRLTGKDAESG
jgi:hypothetical protein